MARRIVLVVGDTAGHFYPALAVADAYRAFANDLDALFLGPAGGIAAQLAAAHGCRFQPIAGSPFVRVGAPGKIAAMGRSLVAIAQARRVLREHGAALVMGFGGYISGSVLAAARIERLGTAIHEANVWPGLANRLLARLAERVYLHFAAAARHFPADRVLVTGWPVRGDVRKAAQRARSAPTADRPARILVIGSSRGEDFFAQRVPALLERVAARGIALDVQHQIGSVDPVAVRDAYARARIPAIVTPYIERMSDAYGWADFAIARAGAGTIAELAVTGIPALLVPLADAAENHQVPNAEAFASGTGALWSREADWNVERLASRVALLVGDTDAWRAASEGVRRLAAPDAAERVVADCERFMRGTLVIYLLLLGMSAALSLVLTPLVRESAMRLGLMDVPGARKIHLRPVPRLGGISVAVSAATGFALTTWLHPLMDGRPLDLGHAVPIVLGGAAVFSLGLWDDLHGVTPVAKIAVQTVVALLVAASGIVIERVTVLGVTLDLGMLAIPATVIWIVGLINAFNLMDGLDGLAAGLGVIAAGTCAAILISRGHYVDALLLVALLGATVGFLPFNFYPASIFLGDSGSLLVGFMLAVTAITGWQKGATALAVGVPLLIFALPIVETVSSIVRRLLFGASASSEASGLGIVAQVFEADQRHIHHRLLAGGLSHRGAVLLLYGLATGLSALALLWLQAP